MRSSSFVPAFQRLPVSLVDGVQERIILDELQQGALELGLCVCVCVYVRERVCEGVSVCMDGWVVRRACVGACVGGG